MMFNCSWPPGITIRNQKMIYILERMWSKFGHRLDFERSKILCEVIDWILRGQKLDVKSKLGLNLVQTWSLVGLGQNVALLWTLIGQNMDFGQ